MNESLTQKYILMTKELINKKCEGKKIKLKFNNIEKKENVEKENIEMFCNALKNLDLRDQEERKIEKIVDEDFDQINEEIEKEKDNKELDIENEEINKEKTKKLNEQNLQIDFKILDISLNNLNETNLFQIISSVYDNKKIIGLNLKYNKLTENILKKIISIIEEKKHFEYLNIQYTFLNYQAIKQIIFYSLNKNNIKTLKLPSLNLNAFQTLVQNLKNNTSLNKLYFSITSDANINKLNTNTENELLDKKQHILINNLKKTFNTFLDVIENKTNLLKIKCDIDFKDDEFEELTDSLVSICEEHKEILEKENKIKKNKMIINSKEIMNLLKTDILEENIHIPKFEKEESKLFEPDAVNIIQKMLF